MQGNELNLTAALLDWQQAADDPDVVSSIYSQLRALAHQALEAERGDHTLQPTALVHEAFIRLSESPTPRWANRQHFFAVAAKVMRRVLIDYARARMTQKRGSGAAALPLTELGLPTPLRPPEMIALDDALSALEGDSPRRAAIVELRFFGGLSLDEAAEVLGCSRATVVREWRLTRAWLFLELELDEA
ncbi:MAG: ECF-type sigma factor [Acidobacteriota bacterium]